jgi:DNA polymerase-3 subunit beta
VGDGVARMVTTDGHRLSKAELKTRGKIAIMLIPLKAIAQLRKLCDDCEADQCVSVSQSGPNVFFDFGAHRFSAKLVDAQFPPYQQVIPPSHQSRAVLPRLAVIDALRAVQLSISKRVGGMTLSFDAGKVSFSGESPDSGTGADEVLAEYTGKKFAIGVSASYLLDVLGAIDSESFALEMSGELDPIMVRPLEQKDCDYVAVIMPLRI